LDEQVANGGFLQVMLNRYTFLFYTLFTEEYFSLLEGPFNVWGRVMYSAHRQLRETDFKMFTEKMSDDWHVVYKKFESEYDELDKSYYQKRDLFWGLFRNFVRQNTDDFFVQ
jgi:hypothetical protein